MTTSSLERKDPDVFWLRVCLLKMSKWNLQYIPFLLNWCSWLTTFSNLKTYLPSALKHLFGCHFKHLWKKRNIIVTFQSGQLTEQPKTLDDIGRFDLKMFHNCPIRIEIINGSHIFILFLPRVVTLCLHFTARGKIFGIKFQPVVKTI
jgi:hypothetical protein